MVHLSLEIDNRQDLLILLPLLERLHIRYSSDEGRTTASATTLTTDELAFHRQIIRQGATFAGIQDPAEWQQTIRKDRELPFREEI